MCGLLLILVIVLAACPVSVFAEEETYTVQRGDSLTGIAREQLGDWKEWRKIYLLNQDQINNPDLIYAGQVFLLDLTDADQEKLDSWDENAPEEMLYLEYKDIFDNAEYYEQDTGEIIWPENGGFEGEIEEIILEKGVLIDRYGSDYGTYVCPCGISYEERSCAPGTKEKPYSVFTVEKAFAVQAGEIAPWFDEPGGGEQYILPESVMTMIEDGYLSRVG